MQSSPSVYSTGPMQAGPSVYSTSSRRSSLYDDTARRRVGSVGSRGSVSPSRRTSASASDLGALMSSPQDQVLEHLLNRPRPSGFKATEGSYRFPPPPSYQVRMDQEDTDDGTEVESEIEEQYDRLGGGERRSPAEYNPGLLDTIARVDAALGSAPTTVTKAQRDTRTTSTRGSDRGAPVGSAFGAATGAPRPHAVSESSRDSEQRFQPPARTTKRMSGPERFFYDKSSYTGTAARGGQSLSGGPTALSSVTRGGLKASGGMKP